MSRLFFTFLTFRTCTSQVHHAVDERFRNSDNVLFFLSIFTQLLSDTLCVNELHEV